MHLLSLVCVFFGIFTFGYSWGGEQNKEESLESIKIFKCLETMGDMKVSCDVKCKVRNAFDDDETECSETWHAWVEMSIDNPLPRHAFKAGFHKDGSDVYVIRAPQGNELSAGKYIPSLRKASTGFYGKEYDISKFEILTGCGLRWVIPNDRTRLPAGSIASGWKQFVGRALKNYHNIPGKIIPEWGIIFIPLNGREEQIDQFEVLVG